MGFRGLKLPKFGLFVWCGVPRRHFLIRELLDLLWEGVLAASDSDGQLVVVVATRLQLCGWRQIRRFFQFNGAIKRQLKGTPGSINYWLRADFLRLRFYTISVWEDDRSIDEFVRIGDHRAAMAGFDEVAVRGESDFTRWKTAPPMKADWRDAAKRLS